jgi:hypothetical protein
LHHTISTWMQDKIFPWNLAHKYVRSSQIRISMVKMTATNQIVLNWTTRNQAKACIIKQFPVDICTFL